VRLTPLAPSPSEGPGGVRQHMLHENRDLTAAIGRVGTGRRPPEAARRRPPGTEHGSRREEPHHREHVEKPERPPPGFPTGRYAQAAALS
jgi:hypothetical protein